MVSFFDVLLPSVENSKLLIVMAKCSLLRTFGDSSRLTDLMALFGQLQTYDCAGKVDSSGLSPLNHMKVFITWIQLPVNILTSLFLFTDSVPRPI